MVNPNKYHGSMSAWISVEALSPGIEFHIRADACATVDIQDLFIVGVLLWQVEQGLAGVPFRRKQEEVFGTEVVAG